MRGDLWSRIRVSSDVFNAEPHAESLANTLPDAVKMWWRWRRGRLHWANHGLARSIPGSEVIFELSHLCSARSVAAVILVGYRVGPTRLQKSGRIE